MPETYFETFLRAVERCRDRDGILGEEALVFPPNEDYGYGATPRNAVTFGDMGVDGVHYAILKLHGVVTDDSPVITVYPMEEEYAVLGDSFLSYLATACGVTIEVMQAVCDDERAGNCRLAEFLRRNYDHSRFYDRQDGRLAMYLKMIEPWE